MKAILVGAGIFMSGFIVVLLCSALFSSGNAENSYYYAIIFSVLYLSGIVGVYGSLILDKLKQKEII